MKLKSLFILLFLSFSFISFSQIPKYSISQITGVDVNGVADSLNVVCEVEGVVQSINFYDFRVNFYVNDGTGGMAVYRNDINVTNYFEPKIGDKIKIIGKVTQFRGMIQFEPTSFQKVSTGNSTVAPYNVLDLKEADEGKLVTLENCRLANPGLGTWDNQGSEFTVSIIIGNSGKYATLRVTHQSEMFEFKEPQGSFNITGFVGQWDYSNPFTADYMILPQSFSSLRYLPLSDDIGDIQFVNSTKLAAGNSDPDNYNYGDTVIVEGVITFHPGFHANSSIKLSYMQSKDGLPWEGIVLRSNPFLYGMSSAALRNAIKMYENFTTGNYIYCRGILANINGTTGIDLLPEETKVYTSNVEYSYKKLKLDQFMKDDGSGNMVQQLPTGEQWEGMLVQFDDVIVSQNVYYNQDEYWFYFKDGDSNEMQMYIYSGYFQTGKNVDSLPVNYRYKMPPVGTNLEYVRGIMFQYNNKFEILPLYPDDVKIKSLKPDICLVSSDSISGRNMVVWERPTSTKIDSYRVYRETTTANKYQYLKSISYNTQPVFIDTTAVPLQRAYRYKLSVIDKNGIESELSELHKTIHLTANSGTSGEVNLIWSDYQGFEFNTYKIYRGTSPTNLTLLDSIQSTLNSYTDFSPPSGLVYYQVLVDKKSPCYPSNFRASNYSGPFSQSFSNLKDFSAKQEDYLNAFPTSLSIPKAAGSSKINVYTSITNWIVQSDQSWLQVKQDLGTKTVEVTYDENTGPIRTAKITLLGTGVDNFEIEVTQDGTTSIIEQEEIFTVYPNPVKDFIILDFNKQLDEDINIFLFDITGRQILSQKFDASYLKTTNSLVVEVNEVPKGNYIMQIVSPGLNLSKRIVIE